MKTRCQGLCDLEFGCRGDVVEVSVYDPRTLREYGSYHYCQGAIEVERGRGFDVRVEPGPNWPVFSAI